MTMKVALSTEAAPALENWSWNAAPPVSFTASPENVTAQGAMVSFSLNCVIRVQVLRFKPRVSGVDFTF